VAECRTMEEVGIVQVALPVDLLGLHGSANSTPNDDAARASNHAPDRHVSREASVRSLAG
jgi:hypothetical protein